MTIKNKLNGFWDYLTETSTREITDAYGHSDSIFESSRIKSLGTLCLAIWVIGGFCWSVQNYFNYQNMEKNKAIRKVQRNLPDYESILLERIDPNDFY